MPRYKAYPTWVHHSRKVQIVEFEGHRFFLPALDDLAPYGGLRPVSFSQRLREIEYPASRDIEVEWQDFRREWQ